MAGDTLTVRQLIARFGFEVDDKKLDGLDEKVKRVKSNVADMGEKFKAAGDKITGFGDKVAARVSLPLLAAATAAVKFAAQAAGTQAKYDVVFGKMKADTRSVWDTQNAWIADMREKYGRAADDLKEWSSKAQDLFVPFGFARDRAADLSKQLVEMSIDLGSFYSMSEDEALEHLTGTLVGMHRNALRFGVVINENTLKTELLAMKAKKVNNEYTEQDKVLARLHLLMKGTADAQGDATRRAEGFGQQMKRFKSMTKEAFEVFGEIVLPQVIPFIRYLRQALEVIVALDEPTKLLIVKWAAVAIAVGPAIRIFGMFFSTIGKVLLFIDGIKKVALALRAMGAAALWAEIQLFLIPLAIVAILALIGYLVYRYWDQIKPVLLKIGAWFKAAWIKARDFIVSNYVLILSVLFGPVGYLVAQTIKHWSTVKAWALGAWASIKAAAPTILLWVKRYVLFLVVWLTWPFLLVYAIARRYWAQLSAFGSIVWGMVAAYFRFVVSWLATMARVAVFVMFWPLILLGRWVRDNWETVKEWLTAAWTWIKDAVDLWWRAMRAPIVWLIDAVKALAERFGLTADKLKGYAGQVGDFFADLAGKARAALFSVYENLPGPIQALLRWLGGEGGTPEIRVATGVNRDMAGTPNASPGETGGARIAAAGLNQAPGVTANVNQTINVGNGATAADVKRAAKDGAEEGVKFGGGLLRAAKFGR